MVILHWYSEKTWLGKFVNKDYCKISFDIPLDDYFCIQSRLWYAEYF